MQLSTTDLDGLPPGPTDPSVVLAVRMGRDPYSFLEECGRRHGDLFTLRLPGVPPRIVTSDPALVRQIFSLGPDDYEQAAQEFPVNIGEGSLLFLDGERHRRDRQLMTPHLHGERLRGYATLMRDTTREVVGQWRPGQTVTLQPALQEITLHVILRCVFGLHDQAKTARFREPLLAWLNETMTPLLGLAGMVFGPRRVRRFLDESVARVSVRPAGAARRLLPWERMAEHKAEVLAMLRAEVERCRREGSGDRSDVLALLADARYEDGEPMEVGHIVDELVTLLVGGHETTASTLAWTLQHVLSHPEVMANLEAEQKRVFGDGPFDPARAAELLYLDACIKEAMRLSPIAIAVSRTLRRPIEMRGYRIPAGTILFPCVYLTHRRADLWPEPERYFPDRFLAGSSSTNQFFPFGGGRRACLGMTFAYFEMRIVLAEIFSQVRLRMAPGQSTTPVFRGITVVPSAALQVIVDGASLRRGLS